MSISISIYISILCSGMTNILDIPSQRARAEARKRVKGHFVKTEEYDSDNINVTQSF